MFGISGEELSTLQEQGLETKPKKYDSGVDRYQVNISIGQYIFALIKFSIDLLAFNSRYRILFDFNGSSLCAGSWLPFQSHEDFVRILRLHCSRLPYWWWYRFLNLFLSKSSNTLLRPSIPCRRREENLHIYLAKLIDNYSKT